MNGIPLIGQKNEKGCDFTKVLLYLTKEAGKQDVSLFLDPLRTLEDIGIID